MTTFWNDYQPGFRFTTFAPGTAEFFSDVERERYALEPHIPALARFGERRDAAVLEVGCGIATDGIRFARAGAEYTGVDLSERAIDLARQRFVLEGVDGSFVHASATDLPFADASFDVVYSHGVIHHIRATARAVQEFHRVLRPGGEAVVMVYHRDSLNYRLNIMTLRRGLAPLVLNNGTSRLLSKLTGEDRSLIEAHRRLFKDYGRRYVTDKGLFLSNNTDGPGNPLSKVYSRAEMRRLFEGFTHVETETRFLNLRIWPGGERLSHTRLARSLEDRWGWHLWVTATK